jgi:hypothetical protein
MTGEEIRSEVEREPFVPFRLHLVSGKTFDVTAMATVLTLRNSVLILTPPVDGADEGEYIIIALRNIERIERLGPYFENR